MKLAPSFSPLAIFMAQSAAASWTFSWRDPGGTPHVVLGTLNNECKVINHGKGQRFEWDRSFWSDCCIKLYVNPYCSGEPAGDSCSDWKKTASVALLSYEVTSCEA